VDIAHRALPDATELEVADLEQALALEPTWDKSLYHDVLLHTLCGD
ncbi:MAG: hypothetical protein H7Y06_03435, partial [Opitutaceae bacterium]|nr:hypothetical protein [Opitutaceae bacterium]